MVTVDVDPDSEGGGLRDLFSSLFRIPVEDQADKTCQAVQAQFSSVSGDLDFILLGGEKFTLEGFLKVCPYLERQRDKILSRRLNVRDPKRDTLEEVAGMLAE